MDRHSCTIIIDTNQFCSDYMLSRLRWVKLTEYLDKTNASLQMPSIVWEELKRNYEKQVSKLLTSSASEVEKLNNHTCFRADNFNFGGLRHVISSSSTQPSLSELAERYLSFVKQKLRLKGKDFLLWEPNWLEDIVVRAINHVKPFGDETDKGFKDTLLWKTILSLGKRHGFSDAPIVLISANSKDFGDPNEKGRLHPTLVLEARGQGLDLHYFENLDVFLDRWAAEVIEIDIVKMKKMIPDVLLKKALRKHVGPWVRKNEAIIENITLTGVNYRVESEAEGKVAIRISMSGYVTNTWTSYEYLDFMAEGVYAQGEHGDEVVISEFSVPIKDKLPQFAWGNGDY